MYKILVNEFVFFLLRKNSLRFVFKNIQNSQFGILIPLRDCKSTVYDFAFKTLKEMCSDCIHDDVKIIHRSKNLIVSGIDWGSDIQRFTKLDQQWRSLVDKHHRSGSSAYKQLTVLNCKSIW